MEPNNLLLVVDLEATCDEHHRIPREETEIIEIGAVLIDEATLETIDELQTFVKPKLHPTLTDFCKRLTTIEQKDVDDAPTFPEAIARLMAWLDGRTPQFCCWGDYDWAQLRRDARKHGMKLALGKEHINLKKRFSKTPHGMNEALASLGLPLEGTHHRGIDDARNIARMLPWIFGRR